jgi:tRNA 5-methylaminomethyl-2-thiouridine biosynthesis bifunctional protein
VVIATGAELHNFTQTAELPVIPVRGQVSYLPATASSSTLRCPVCYHGYVLPARDGMHVIGASFRVEDATTTVRDEEHGENLHALLAWLPQMFNDAAVPDGRAGVRAVSPDRLPLVGPVADGEYFHRHYGDLQRGRAADTYPAAGYLPGLYVNVGHGARGLTSSLLCAEILAAQLNNEPSPVYTSVQHALHPARFMIRAFKKGNIC